MEPLNQNDDDDCFFDALDDFPFHDSIVTDQSANSASTSSLSEPLPYTSSLVSILRRRSISRRVIKDSTADFSLISSDAVIIDDTETRSRDKRLKFYRGVKGHENNLEGAESSRWIPYQVHSLAVGGVGEEAKEEESTVTTANDDRVGDSVDSAGELDPCGLPLC